MFELGKSKPKSRLKNPKIMAPVVIVLLVIAAFGLAVRNMNSPAEGTVTTPLNDNVASAAKPQLVDKTYSGTALNFKYPAKFQINPSTKSAGYLDSVMLIQTDRRDEYAAIGVTHGTLTSDSGVSYRRLHSNLYKSVSSTATSAVFTKSDNTEYTGFIQHDGLIASISLTSVSPGDLSSDYNTIAESLQWKQ